MKKLILLGAGGFARTITDIVKQGDVYNEVLYLDDNKKSSEIIGKCADFTRFVEEGVEMYPAIADNSARLTWIDRLSSAKVKIATVVHPTAYVSPSVALPDGVAVLPMAVVNTGAVISEGAIINCSAVIDHDAVIGRGAHVRPGAVVLPHSRVCDLVVVEANSVFDER